MQRCPRCQRANPAAAGFCHHDGLPLTTLHLGGGDSFLREWRFPSGRTCRNIDELVQGCLSEWAEARNALVRRDFVRFFEDNHRHDLARLVPPAEPDPEAALQSMLERLPTKVKVAPSLDVVPRRLHIPTLARGEDRRVVLTLVNRGSGLLHGDLIVADGIDWLRLNANRFRTRHDQPIEVTIDSRKLPAAGSYLARVQVRSNGGTLEVPVQADLLLRGVAFQGTSVADPADVAKLMLSRPKEAARWLGDGTVERLFDREGWAYPLEGVALAPSLGAVQQFFEALGLSSVPRVEVDVQGFEVTCEPDELATRAVTVSTASKKWVYATATSDALWLKPRQERVAGARTVDVLFDVDPDLLDAGRVHQGNLFVTVNGGVEHTVWVRAEVPRRRRA